MLNSRTIKPIGKIAHLIKLLIAFGNKEYTDSASQKFVDIVDKLSFYNSANNVWKDAFDEMNCLLEELQKKINPLC